MTGLMRKSEPDISLDNIDVFAMPPMEDYPLNLDFSLRMTLDYAKKHNKQIGELTEQEIASLKN